MSDPGKLRWRCRRGTLELDRMLIGYLDCRYPQAGSEERLAFLRLLDLEDADLLGCLLGERVAGDSGLAAIVAIIRQQISSGTGLRLSP